MLLCVSAGCLQLILSNAYLSELLCMDYGSQSVLVPKSIWRVLLVCECLH